MMGFGSNGRGYGPGMMGGAWQGNSAHALPTRDAASGAFQGYIDATGNPDLVLDEVMQFKLNYYAIVKEQSSGRGAFELLADPQTGVSGLRALAKYPLVRELLDAAPFTPPA